jgi:hypothetical protein
MSKTDKTAPWRVKGAQRARERHNHIKGYCDLAPREKNGVLPEQYWSATGCYWELDWHDPMLRCSCAMCSEGLKEEGRRKRYAAKREIREQLKDW